MATGRSDYPNQVNNVLGFPFIFRGALDVQARTINDAMKIAATRRWPNSPRQEVPDQVAAAFHRPPPDLRPGIHHPCAIRSPPYQPCPTGSREGCDGERRRRRPIVDVDAYVARLKGRLDPGRVGCKRRSTAFGRRPKRVIFAEGEDPTVIRAANTYLSQGFGQRSSSDPRMRSKSVSSNSASRCAANSRSSIRRCRPTPTNSQTSSTSAFSAVDT